MTASPSRRPLAPGSALPPSAPPCSALPPSAPPPSVRPPSVDSTGQNRTGSGPKDPRALRPAPTKGGRSLRVLGFGTYDTERHPRVGIILDGLRGAGDQVLVANAPLGFTTSERVEMLHRPWLILRLAWRLARRWRQIARSGRAIARQAPTDAVVVGYLGHFDVVLARLLFPRTTVVLDLLIFAADTARDRGVTNPVVLLPLRCLDRLAAACADVIVVDTDEHRQLLSRRDTDKSVTVAVGAPLRWFPPSGSGAEGAARVPEVPVGPLRVVFFGLYTPLQGADCIGAALGALAHRTDIEVTMIGKGQQLTEARRRAGTNPRVTWVDWVAPDQLPVEVGTFDVCLGIFGTTPKAGRVVPNKVFQGAAAGCAIVTSDTPPQRRLLGPHAVLVPPGDPAALAGALAGIAEDRAALERLKLAAAALARSEFTPEAVTEPLRHRLGARRRL